MKEVEQLVKNISETNDFKKLEFTIIGLIMGWTIDDTHQDEYKELIRLSVGRLKFLSIINGIDHPLMDMDVDTEEDRIKTSFRLSMLQNIMEKGKPKFDFNLN
jgi:hypothetical protein